jgi:hypothetical protein
MGKKRRKIPKILLHPIFQWLRGKMGNVVFRRSHNGQVSMYPAPDMTHVKWSKAQKNQRKSMTRASKYGHRAIQDPEIRQYYVELAIQRKMNPRRPYDAAVSDYFGGNDLLWKKLHGDQQKPEDWCW